MSGPSDARPLIVHVVFRLDYGGLENGVVNLVNGLWSRRFRHAVVALTEATDFSHRLREGVPVYAIGKRPGKDPVAYWRLYRLLRRLRPAVVHTRNFGTLECGLVAAFARVPVRVHGEHGWDIYDPHGTKRKYRISRRLIAPFIHVFVTVSDDLRRWLVNSVGIPASKVTRICNGVDVRRFRPRETEQRALLPEEFGARSLVLGTVARFSAIKDPLNLVEAFIRLREKYGTAAASVRLMMIGDGELRGRALARLSDAKAADVAWLPGSRDDVPELLRTIDIFVLGSLREGISNTILEAMATGLPVVATDTGGNGELVAAGETGTLVPPGDAEALSDAIAAYVLQPELRARHGERGRERAVTEFSIETMLSNYEKLYERTVPIAGA
jgi:sugar transferase (PEP-CTERM/EpsH1 system associated)